MAPTNLREKFLKEIALVTEGHSEQTPGRIFVKLNALADRAIIEAYIERPLEALRCN